MSQSVRWPALAVFFALTLVLTALGRPDDKPAEKPAPTKPVDLILCLDVSGSMNGLIDSAKIKLWDIVNEMSRLKPLPKLRVALYSYGHTTYSADKGWVRKDIDLTDDLDALYRELNALTIRGGTEYVARVTQAALSEQKWSNEDGLKLIFVCGNEPADQDKQVSLDDVAKQAKKQGVIVNTIYCGRASNAEARGWSAFAESCGGRYMNIDQNKTVQQAAIKTEFDEKILKLGDELGKTYLAYGKDGKERSKNQAAQDQNAFKAKAKGGGSDAALGRSLSKSSPLYRNAGWDLIDRMKEEKDFDLSKIKEEDLPDELKKLKPDERLAYVKKKAEERAAIQKQINELSTKRQKAIDAERAKKPQSKEEQALDEAVRAVVREQAKAKGFDATEAK